jgi:hypothetical protein
VPLSVRLSQDHQIVSKQFRRTLVQVLSVQVVTLLLLWLLQAHYAR